MPPYCCWCTCEILLGFSRLDCPVFQMSSDELQWLTKATRHKIYVQAVASRHERAGLIFFLICISVQVKDNRISISRTLWYRTLEDGETRRTKKKSGGACNAGNHGRRISAGSSGTRGQRCRRPRGSSRRWSSPPRWCCRRPPAPARRRR